MWWFGSAGSWQTVPWVVAVLLGGGVACGGRSVEQGTGIDPDAVGGVAGVAGVGGTGGAGAIGPVVGGAGGAASAGRSGGSGADGGAMVGRGGGISAGAGGSQGGAFTIGKGSPVVREACAEFCQALPASCPMSGEEGCGMDCVHAGNDSPSCIEEFAAYMKCLARQLDPAAGCDESCSGAYGCASEAIAACDAERVAWEVRFEECGTTTRDYEAPSAGCRRSSACNSYVTECGLSENGTTWDCQCFNIRPDGITGPIVQPGAGDECLAAARICQGL